MKFACLAFPQLEELDLIGPWEMISGLKSLGKIEDAFIVAETVTKLTCAKGLMILPHYGFENCPEFDYLLIPGGWGTRAEVKNPVLLDFLRARIPHCKAVLSVCTGAFILAELGVLDGKKATTHWGSLERLRGYERIEVVEERFVRDGTVWSSAGVSAGIDLILAFIAETLGHSVAEAVQFQTEFYPEGTVYGEPAKRAEAPQYLRERSIEG